MDLNGNSWVGNIYHKFEAICQEVDEFVSKDTVRYVENHVQSVGVSVKKLYTDVVKDILPPSVDLGCSDNLRNDNSEQSDDLGLFSHKPHCTDSSLELKTDAPMKLIGDTLMWNDSNTISKENTEQTSLSLPADSSAIKEVLSVKFDGVNTCSQDQFNTKLFIASSSSLSVPDFKPLSLKQRGSLSPSFSGDSEIFSKIPRTELLSEDELSIVQDLELDVSRRLPKSPEPFTLMPSITPALGLSMSFCLDAVHTDSPKDRTFSDSFSTKDECFMASTSSQTDELVLPNVSCDDMCNTHVPCKDGGFYISRIPAHSPLISTASNDIKAVDSLLALSIVESNALADYHPSMAHESVFVGSSEGNSDICILIDDLNMDTIDLSNNVKCDVLNNNFVRSTTSTSYRRKNFYYYKKLLKDAFTSNKRLSKEYEDLAILYGDVDLQSKQHFDSPASQQGMPGFRSSQKASTDSEWELL